MGERHDYAAPFDPDSAIRASVKRIAVPVFRRHRIKAESRLSFAFGETLSLSAMPLFAAARAGDRIITITGGMVRVPDTGGTPETPFKANETGEIVHRWPQVLPGGQKRSFFSAAITPANCEDALINVMS